MTPHSEPWRCQSLEAWRTHRVTPHLHPRLVRSREVVSDARRCVEHSWERDFHDGRLVDLRHAVRALPLLVQCAVRVHDRREGEALVFGLDLQGCSGRTERRTVVVGRCQRCVLLFSPRGALDAAGLLRLRGIEWDERLEEHDWY